MNPDNEKTTKDLNLHLSTKVVLVMTSALDRTTSPVRTINPQSLEKLKELCRIPHEIMMDSLMPEPTESPEDHHPGFFCVYEIYFKGCGLTLPLPEALVRFLAALEIALPQLTPNLL